MQPLVFAPTFEDWRRAARQALEAGLHPQAVAWEPAQSSQGFLNFTERHLDVMPAESSEQRTTSRVPKRFLEMAKLVAAHSNPERWGLLYRALWRLTHGEPELLENPLDSDLARLVHLEKEVSKDAYRVQAFVRFRKVHTEDGPWFVAWYEPEHDVIAFNADFFVNRFANMRWSILTQKRCMHWNGTELSFGEGMDKSQTPPEDAVEELWLTYYAQIFNPARIKVAAMQAQLPKRNWKNLPEASLIAPLLRAGPTRVASMLMASDAKRVRDSDYTLAVPPETPDWDELARSAAVCRACPLHKTASCTVFGEGPTRARIVLVGEQPGDQEDRTGKPFVGPAGQMLDRALAQAGVDRSEVYVTNAVKHFKWEPRGKRRIHQTPNARDIASCRPWLEAELRLIKPELIVCLGATAARSVFGAPVKITAERGRLQNSVFGKTLVTIHPSALLRLPDKSREQAEYERFVEDLDLIGSAVRGLPPVGAN